MGNMLCTVAAILRYIAEPSLGQACHRCPFFIFNDGRPLTCEKYSSRTLEDPGPGNSRNQSREYAGHSFRFGAATSVAGYGIQDSLIKTLGRWESVAYMLNIRTPRLTICSVAKSLAGKMLLPAGNIGNK